MQKHDQRCEQRSKIEPTQLPEIDQGTCPPRIISAPMPNETFPAPSAIANTEAIIEEEDAYPAQMEDTKTQELLAAEEDSLRAMWQKVMARKAALKT